MSGRVCAVCGARPAPFGFGFPGFRRDRPKGRGGYAWACARDDCRAALKARRDRAAGLPGAPSERVEKPGKGRPTTRDAERADARQADLFAAAPKGARPDLWGR